MTEGDKEGLIQEEEISEEEAKQTF